MEAGDGANRFLVIFVAALTGVGGGVLRDLFAGDRPYISVKHVYACSALLGALVCAVPAGRLWDGQIAMLVGFVLVFAMRSHLLGALPLEPAACAASGRGRGENRLDPGVLRAVY